MAKKHWIYIKRGLSEDPKHRSNMGECVWLYMHIIDRADWETGIAFDWKDKEEAAEMSMPVDTLRRQRQKLQELDYIRAEQKQHSQNIYIMEWKNPRDYSSETKNPRGQGSHEQPPSEIEGLNQGSNQGLNQGSNQVQAQDETPTYTSLSDSSSLSNNGANAPRDPQPRQRRTDAQVRGDVFDGMQHFAAQAQALAEQTGIEAGAAQAILDFPVDVRAGVQMMYTHFGIRAIPEKPTSGRGGDYADWIVGVRDLQKISAAYKVDFSHALEVTQKVWSENRFTVARPGALKKTMSGALAQKESKNGNNHTSSKPNYTPDDLAAAERINARNADRQARLRGV